MELKDYYRHLFMLNGMDPEQINDQVIQSMAGEPNINGWFEEIKLLQTKMQDAYRIKNKIFDVQNHRIVLPNAKVRKPYSAKINIKAIGTEDLAEYHFSGLEELGLSYNRETDSIEGTPQVSGDIKIYFQFKVIGEQADTPLHEKPVNLVINPDPKDLWKNIPSDPDALFAKPDISFSMDQLGDRTVVAASKRGRSHANVGSFRDDDYAYKHIDKTGWSVVVVSDGAGSASLAREGSRLACLSVIDYFENIQEAEKQSELDNKIKAWLDSGDETLKTEALNLSRGQMYKAALHTYNRIKDLSDFVQSTHPELFDNPRAKSNIEYFHSTLIFTLFKKFDQGYVFQTFSVGDCPIGLMSKDRKSAKLLNWLDVGEFGGGTRFITQVDIFHKQEVLATRFNLHFAEDFSYLFMMTDGIYDPKFVVEANLDKDEKWVEFLADIEGQNEDNSRVNLDSINQKAAEELSNWMDFWSVGNHDDRTLTIVF